MKNRKKIAFCITCMNRLSHIQQTLVRNIEDNYFPDDVEFILLNYNSQDGLEEWVNTLKSHVETGILQYYRIETPASYHRSHSRNIAFRLSNSSIVCNLDADNFLGKGFAEFIIRQFSEAKEKIFITSPFCSQDVYGRFCARQDDFIKIRGYNELLAGYGMEDTDIYQRLIRIGLQQKVFYDPAFCGAIKHTHKERVSEECLYTSLFLLYLSYETPFRSAFLLLRKDNIYESGRLINNKLCHFNTNRQYTNLVDKDLDISTRVVMEGEIEMGEYLKSDNTIDLIKDGVKYTFNLDDTKIQIGNSVFYKISDENILYLLILHISMAVNYTQSQKFVDEALPVNPNGFGQGIVYKNFDYNTPIILD